MTRGLGERPLLLPANRSERVTRVFAWNAKRMIARQFHALRITEEGRELLAHADGEPRPVILTFSHPSWWDPLVGLVLQRMLMPSRDAWAVMDVEQLQKFGVLRRIGVFGIDPEAPVAIDALKSHAMQLFDTAERPLLGITPQGRFTDPRSPIRLRPGAAAVAAAAAAAGRTPVVIAVALEYAFWLDQRPEVLVHARRVVTPGELDPVRSGAEAASSRAKWHRAIGDAMQVAADLLADRVIARDPSGFETLIGGRSSGTNPVYDAWLRLTGRSAELRDRRAAASGSDGPAAGGSEGRGR